MLMESPLLFILYTKSWLLDSSYHLTSSLPLSDSWEYSWWIWKWEAKDSQILSLPIHPIFHFSEWFSILKTFAEKISYSFVLPPCFLFVSNPSVISPHPQHSLSKAAFSHTDLELCNCRKWQLTFLRISTLLTELLNFSCLFGISDF